MESNTSASSPAAWTSHAAVVEHGEPSVRDASLLSPAFSPAPWSPGLLVPASGSGSQSSWPYQQIPPLSPAVAAVGNGSLSVQAHATTSPSPSQSVPSSSFPAVDTLPMVGYDDLFDNPEAMPATPLLTLPGDQWEQGESSAAAWAAAPVLPECPSPGTFIGLAGESAAWASEDMPSFFSPPPSSAGGDLVPQSSDNLVGFAQPPSSDPDSDELEALLQSFSIPAPAVEESPVVDAQMPPVEEEVVVVEEEMDISSFLVSDPVEQLPNASWTASPQMASGGGASASWMVPAGNTGNNNWPPMLAPAAASTCTMASTSSGIMACHSAGGSSTSAASSIVGAMMKPSSSVLPLVPPSSSSQGAGASRSSSKFNGFAQPSSSSVLAPRGDAHAPNLQGAPLVPVKQEIIDVDDDDDDATARHHPDIISLDDDDDEEGFYPDANFGNWGSSGSPSFATDSWGGGSSSSPSFAPGSWGSSGVSPGFAPGSWGGGSSNSPSFAPGSWGDGGSSSSRSFAPSSPRFDGSMPGFDQSMSIDNYGSPSSMSIREEMASIPSSMSIRGKMASIPGLPPLPKSLVRASYSNNGTGVFFTDPEMAIIAREPKLQELLKTDVKKVKRMLYNRSYSAAAKVRRVMHTQNLERAIVTLEERRRSLLEKLQSLQEGSAALKAQQMEMQIIIGELEKQTMIKDVVREGLTADIKNLKHLKLN